MDGPKKGWSLTDFDIDQHGRITSPGKFEGEMIYLPHFWAEHLDAGMGPNQDGSFSLDVWVADIEDLKKLVIANFGKGPTWVLGMERAIKHLEGKHIVSWVERDDGMISESGHGTTARLKTPEERA